MPVIKPSAPARAAHALMCAAVALYGAMILVLSLGHTLPLPLFFLIAAALFALLMLLARRVPAPGVALPVRPDAASPRVFFAAFALCLSVMLVYLLGFYPGGLSSDSVIQWVQVHTPAYDDRHPALHTLILAALYAVCDTPVFVLAVQMVCFALAVGRLACAMWRWRMPRWAVAAIVGYICLSPGISNIMAFLWKDCAFAICALLMGACVVEIYASRGAWLDAPAHIAQLAALLTLCAILRHNGPALALPCIVWLMVAYPARLRRALACALAFAALFAGVKGPLYAAFDVQSADTGITETFGLPMALLTHVYAEAPDALDADIVAYMERIAPWQTFYEHDACGDWNEVKWYVQPIDVSDYTLLQVFSYALRAARAEPQLALEALAGLWHMPLLPFGEAYWRLSPYAEGMFEAQCGGPIVPFFGRALNALARLTAEPALSWLVWNPGFFLLALMGVCCLLARRRPLGALTLPAMLISYDLATALMLSSPTDFRFFITTPMLAPVAALMLVCCPGGGEGA